MPIAGCRLWNDFKNEVNTWQGGHVGLRVFESWVHVAQLEMLNGLIESLGNNFTVTDNLRPFFKSVQLPLNISATGGMISYPKDYRRFVNLRFLSKTANGVGCTCGDLPVMCKDGVDVTECKEMTEEEKAELINSSEACERTIDLIDWQTWGSVCDDKIAGPSVEVPFATRNDKGFKVLPKAIGVVVLDYIKLPERPTINFTRDERHNWTCAAGTTDLAWGEEMLPELLARLKKKFGGFTKDNENYIWGNEETKNTKV